MMNGFSLRHLLFTAICLKCIFSLVWGTTSAPPVAAHLNCSAVTHLLQARGFKTGDIPTDPTKETYHRFCDLPATGSCCTYKMEMTLSTRAKESFQKNTKELIGKLSNVLGSRAHKFNDFFTELLAESKKEFHIMFKRTYGTIYEENAYVFANLFLELENYYTRGKVDLAVAMDSFFNTLYQKMFTVLNSQYILDDKYLGCVSEHMKELKPFGDVPDKLSVQIKRSFVATRTYAQALSTAADVAKALMNIRTNTDCNGALTRMQECSLCQGLTEKPCANYCVNVIKGCLQQYILLDAEWDNFVSSMERLSERLLGPFNIVMVVEPINIKISEAIMNFQETGQAISDQVFKGCGDPVLGRRSRSINSEILSEHIEKSSSKTHSQTIDIDEDVYIDKPKRSVDSVKTGNYDSVEYLPEERQNEQRDRRKNKKKQHGNKKGNNDDEDVNKEPLLDKLIKDIKQKVKDSKKFWSNLPYQVCNYGELASIPKNNESCWNGHVAVRNSDAIAQELPKDNPAITQISQQSQLYYLKTAVNNLRNAYNGLDVEWSDQEEPFDSSGYGSGDGIEDDTESGSGSSSFVEDVLPGTPERPNTPSVQVNTVSTSATNVTGVKQNSGSTYSRDNSKTSGASSKMSQMTLRRALMTYLFPIYMAWFGGIISDLL